jgi:hypothetical protein
LLALRTGSTQGALQSRLRERQSMDAVDLGISGLSALPGEHLCGLYCDVEQRDRVLVPFLREGLRAGDKCICVVDAAEQAPIAAAVLTGFDDPENVLAHQLDMIGAADLYLRSSAFVAAEIISAWKAAISEVMYGGRFTVVRAIENWSLREVVPELRDLLMLESEMNRYLPLFPQVIICMYDLSRFGGSIVVDLLKTHPRILLGDAVLDNPYYVSPDELLRGTQPGPSSIVDREREELAAWCYDATTGST